ncbi:hypothetical protein MKX01_017098 [Papaver californicum]|nr:hypothetical protein MKX01_017098 [Papaver californicum]
MLLFLGILGSVGDGLMNPLTMIVLAGAINDYGNTDIKLTNHVVDKHTLRLLYVALGVAVAAFVEGLCWTRTSERQASRMRSEYLKSVLRQEVSFFDTQAGTSITFDVVSTISSDAHSIQDVIADKIPNYLAHVTSFLLCLVVAFCLSWRLALAALPFSFMLIIPGDAYVVPGGISEQAISSIRTVFTYVGERQTLERFSERLKENMDLGIKVGLTKGMLIGSMGLIFAAWAFLAWVGSILIINRGEKGGAIFATGCSLIMGGMSLMNALPNITFFGVATAAATRMFEMIHRPSSNRFRRQKRKSSGICERRY